MKKVFLMLTVGGAILAVTSAKMPDQPAPTAKLKYGKYTCMASKYRGGVTEYIPRGSFTIKADGTYFYSGFEAPSKGKFSVDKEGNILFVGGYFDKGKAEKIDRPDKYFLVFPTNPDNRWTCTYVAK